MRLSRICLKPKTLAQMFRKLKLAGAHPDVLWAVDAQKAQQNGEQMIRLETLMHQRSTSAHTGSSGEAEDFIFWLSDGPQASLRSVRCRLTPSAPARVVKSQLSQLFRDAGVLEAFDLSDDGVEMHLDSVLRHADERQSDHLHESGALYIRGDRSLELLRRFGVLLVVEERGVTYLATLPEIPAAGGAGGAGAGWAEGAGGAGAGYAPARTLVGPNGEIDPDVREFLREHGLRAFDLRMAGSHSSVERFVSAFERVERMYAAHRGRAMRSGVCIVLALRGEGNYVAADGCIVLAVQRMDAWEEFLLSLPQEEWRNCVEMHRDWRVGNAPKLRARQRRLLRVADMFHFFRISFDSGFGSQADWQEDLLLRFEKEEMMIRNALRKYNLHSELLKRRGEIVIAHSLQSAVDSSKSIGYRIGGDGQLTFSHSAMNTGQMLRVLKDNLKRLENFRKGHDDAVATLEHLSRSMPVDFSLDTNWKLREESNLVYCLERFVRTIKANEKQLAAFLTNLLRSPSVAGVPRKRMVWIISERFDTMPSGVVFIPWDVEFDSIKKHLLTKT